MSTIRIQTMVMLGACALSFSCTAQHATPLLSCPNISPSFIFIDSSSAAVSVVDKTHITLMDGFSGMVEVIHDKTKVLSDTVLTNPSTSIADRISVDIKPSTTHQVIITTENECIKVPYQGSYSEVQIYRLRNHWQVVLSNAPLNAR